MAAGTEDYTIELWLAGLTLLIGFAIVIDWGVVWRWITRRNS